MQCESPAHPQAVPLDRLESVGTDRPRARCPAVSAVPFAPWRSWAGPRAAIPLCTDKIKLTLDLVPSVAANAAVNRDDTLRRSGDGAPLATHFVTSDGQAEGSDEQLLDQSLTADPQDIVEHLAATLTTGVAPPPAPSCSVSTDEATQPPTPSSQASSSISASPSTPATSTAESVKAVLSHSASVDPTPLFEQHLEPPGPPAPPKQYPPYVRSPSPSESTSDPSAAELAWARPSRTLAPKEEGQPYTTSDEFKADQYPYSNTSLYQDYGDATLKSTTSIFHFGSFPAGPSTLSHDRPRFHHDESTSLDPSYGYQTTLEEIERAKVLAAAEEERILRLEARVHARRARNLALNPQPIKAPAPVVIEAAPRVSRIVKPTAKAQALMKRPSRQSRLPQPRPLKNVAQYSRFKRTLATCECSEARLTIVELQLISPFLQLFSPITSTKIDNSTFPTSQALSTSSPFRPSTSPTRTLHRLPLRPLSLLPPPVRSDRSKSTRMSSSNPHHRCLPPLSCRNRLRPRPRPAYSTRPRPTASSTSSALLE